MEEIKYPIGIQSFESLIKGKYIYVDKTAIVHKLVSENKYYFLSRPRRFGKSLLLSTIEALFKAKRHLFEGLAIDSLPWEWEEHEVLHLDLNVRHYLDDSSLVSILARHLCEWESKYGITPGNDIPEDRFVAVIKKAYELSGRGVVILIDEYDKPLLSTLHDKEKQEYYRSLLQAFYGVLKSLDSYIKFGMLTGVTRFSKVSVFSGLNNLRDISLEPPFNSICGVSESELTSYFSESISRMANIEKKSATAIHEELKRNYDGYHFAASGEDMYNPFSILSTFANMRFSSYWFATGTPTFLVKLLEQSNFSIPELEDYKCSEDSLTGSDIYLTDPVPVFYQSGYLTIKGYDHEFAEYTLGFPNKEVAGGFSRFLMKSYLKSGDPTSALNNFVREVRAGHADKFMEKLQSFLADIPYDHIRGDKEIHYENVMYLIMKLMGFHTSTEYRTSDGRIDMVIRTPDYIYVLEFKLDGTPEEALDQINRKEYALPFRIAGKTIYKIGASFSSKTHRMSGWKIEREF